MRVSYPSLLIALLLSCGTSGDDGGRDRDPRLEIDCTPYSGLCDAGTRYPNAYVCSQGQPEGECDPAPDPIDSHVKTSWCCANDCAPAILSSNPCSPGRISYLCHGTTEKSLEGRDCEYVTDTEIPCCL